MKNKLFTTIILGLVLVMCTGCGILDNIEKQKQQSKIDNITNESRQVTINSPDIYKDSLINIICGNEINEDSILYSELFYIENEDIIPNAELKQYYYFNGAIYLQINDTYMYRFQLDNNNVIVSYIKYILEA